MLVKDKRFFECVGSFMNTELPNLGSRSGETKRAYRAGINLYMEYLEEAEGVRLHEAGFANFNADSMLGFKLWMTDYRSLSPETASLRMTAVRMFVTYAGKKHLVDASTQIEVLGVRMPKCHRKLIVPMSKAAVAAILAAPSPSTPIGYRDRNVMVFLYDTAIRCSELTRLRVCDLVMADGGEHAYIRGKGAKSRVVPLDLSVDHVRKYLAAFHPNVPPGSERPLFYPIGDQTRHLSASSVEKMVRKHAELARRSCAEVPAEVYPHLFRHTRASGWLDEGMPIEAIAELLGHSSLSTTQIYAKSSIATKRESMRKYRGDRPPVGDTEAFWRGNEDVIRKLYGLAD